MQFFQPKPPTIKERVIDTTLNRGTIAEQVELLKVLEQPYPSGNIVDSLSRIFKKLLIIFFLLDLLLIVGGFNICKPTAEGVPNSSSFCRVNQELFNFFIYFDDRD